MGKPSKGTRKDKRLKRNQGATSTGGGGRRSRRGGLRRFFSTRSSEGNSPY